MEISIEGEEAFQEEHMYDVYESLKADGLDAVWVPAGHYKQNDGSDDFRLRNKIYLTLTEAEIMNFPISESYSYGLWLTNYADYSYVDGNYKELHQAWWDSNAEKCNTESR